MHDSAHGKAVSYLGLLEASVASSGRSQPMGWRSCDGLGDSFLHFEMPNREIASLIFGQHLHLQAPLH